MRFKGHGIGLMLAPGNMASGSSWNAADGSPSLLTATVENAAPTNVVLTFDEAKPDWDETNFTIEGFTISSASWTGSVLTLVLSVGVAYYEGNFTITFIPSGRTATVTNNVASTGTVAWYQYEDASTLTVDGSNYVSEWRDKLSSGKNLLQATSNLQPLLTVDGVDFYPSTARWLRVVDFATIAQPFQYYFLCKIKTYVNGGVLCDANINGRNGVQESNANLRLFLPSTPATIAKPSENTWTIIRVLYNGVNSYIKVDDNVATGNGGTIGLAGFTLNHGGAVNDSGYLHKMVYKEIIIRGSDDSDAAELAIYEYLKKKSLIETPIPNWYNGILTADGTRYISTEDENYYLQNLK